MQQEIFKDIPEYEGIYQVSNLGKVKSLKFNKEIILKPSKGRGDYLHVILSKNKTQKTFKIHQLVAIVFLNHKSCGMKRIIDHIDNNPQNNNVNNLQITTNRENSSKDKKNPCVKFCKRTSKFVLSIRIKDKNIHIGYFKDKEEADFYYKKAIENIKKYNGSPDHFRTEVLELKRPNLTSTTKGVHLDKSYNRWICSVFENKKRKYLGRFKTEQEAVKTITDYKKRNNLTN